MSVIADFSVPAVEFALGDLLEVREGVRVRLETMVPTGGAMIPYFWVRSPDVEAAEEVLRNSEMVRGVEIVDEVNDESLFRVDWHEEVDGLIEAIADADAAVLEGGGTATTGPSGSGSPSTTSCRASTGPSSTRASPSTWRASTTRSTRLTS